MNWKTACGIASQGRLSKAAQTQTPTTARRSSIQTVGCFAKKVKLAYSSHVL